MHHRCLVHVAPHLVRGRGRSRCRDRVRGRGRSRDRVSLRARVRAIVAAHHGGAVDGGERCYPNPTPNPTPHHGGAVDGGEGLLDEVT